MAERGTAHDALAGLWVPLATPFDGRDAPALPALVARARAVIADGARGVVLAGTTGEGPSLTVAERRALLDGLLAAGIEPARIVAGIACPALGDAVELARHAGRAGVAAVLLMPPFYFKAVTPRGVGRAIDAVLDRAPGMPPVLLYHFPQLSGVPLPVDLVAELAHRHGPRIAGLKDSEGDPARTFRMIDRLPDLAVFPGTEAYLAEACRRGAAGVISATANVAAAPIAAALAAFADGDAGRFAALAGEVRKRRLALERWPMIAAIKQLLAHTTGDPAWARLRPPLEPLDRAAREELLAWWDRAGGQPGRNIS
ncbi:MAG: dihydrodipicolinate synthase family protein [Acidobacteriota bacterium]